MSQPLCIINLPIKLPKNDNFNIQHEHAYTTVHSQTLSNSHGSRPIFHVSFAYDIVPLNEYSI